MATITDVIIAASALATSVNIPPSLKQPGKIYEAWLMLEIAATLRSMRLIADARWEDGTGAAPQRAVFRGGPGPLWDSAKSQQAGFVKITTYDSASFEIHNSVQFKGISEARHEVDISIERHATCKRLRTINTRYPELLPVCVFELKYYKKSSFNIGIVRQFVALQMDLALQNSHKSNIPCFCYLNSSDSMRVGYSGHSYLAIFTSAKSISADARKLAGFYNSSVFPNFDSIPLSPVTKNVMLWTICKTISNHLK